MKANTFFFVILTLIVSSCDCVYNVSGVVIDESTNKPITAVTISRTVDATSKVAHTDELGNFSEQVILRHCNQVTRFLSKEGYEIKRVRLENNSHDTLYMKRKEH